MAIDFTEKLGPLPVWGWGVIGGGVVIVGAYFLNRGGSDGGVVKSAVLDANGYQTAGITGGSASIDSSPTFDNNVLWLTRATAQTAARLAKSPTTVYEALKKWLNGQEITVAQKEIVDTAVGMVGIPPEGTQGLSPTIPDETKPSGPLDITAPKLFYITDSKPPSYGLLFPDGRQVTTTDKATATRWSAEFNQSAQYVTKAQYQAYFDANKSKRP